MNIGWVSPYFPFPPNSGGRIRIDALSNILAARGHTLHLYSSQARRDIVRASEVKSSARAQWASVSTKPNRIFQPGIRPRRIDSFPASLYELIEQDDARAPFDVLIFEHCYSFLRRPRLKWSKIVLMEHNIESEYFRRMWQKNRANAYALWMYLHFRAFERRRWFDCDHVFFVTPNDALLSKNKGLAFASVVPNGIDISAYTFVPPSQRIGNRILFVGTMSYKPNVEAAEYLAREVMPLIRNRVRDATLTIAGGRPRLQVRSLANDFVCVTGAFQNPTSLFSEHTVYINPVDIGAGSSLKVLEPLASGLPLVAGAFAVRGFDCEPQKHYLPATTAAEYANAAIEILMQRASFNDMATRAHNLASRYDWSEIAKPFVDLIESYGPQPQ